MTQNSVSFKRRCFHSTETFFFTQMKRYALAIFSKFDTVPACVKTEEGRRFVVNKTLGCHKAYERSQSKELSYFTWDS